MNRHFRAISRKSDQGQKKKWEQEQLPAGFNTMGIMSPGFWTHSANHPSDVILVQNFCPMKHCFDQLNVIVIKVLVVTKPWVTISEVFPSSS